MTETKRPPEHFSAAGRVHWYVDRKERVPVEYAEALLAALRDLVYQVDALERTARELPKAADSGYSLPAPCGCGSRVGHRSTPACDGPEKAPPCARETCEHPARMHGDQSGHPSATDPCHAGIADGLMECDCEGYVAPESATVTVSPPAEPMPLAARRCGRPMCGHTFAAHSAGACALMVCECSEFVRGLFQ